MYRPRDFTEFRLEEMYRLVREYPLGVLARQTSTGLDADHLPFFLEEGRGALGYLLAHVARANPIWREVREGAEVMMARLTRSHESREPRPWKLRDAGAGYFAEQLSQIIGIEVEMTRLEGKRKLSQNRDARDFDGVLHALEENQRHDLASAMRQVKPSR